MVSQATQHVTHMRKEENGGVHSPESYYSTDFNELTGSIRSSTGFTNSCTNSANAMVAAAAIT